MPRDPRPYTTYPLNYTTHPRLEGLSDAAFRVFHEMQDHSRVHGLDGNIPEPIAARKWRRKALDELVAGAPGTDRPLVILNDGCYFIRSYSEHQFTTDDAAELRRKRAEAGAAGGRSKASKRVASATASAKQVGWQNLAESKSESELTTKTDFGDSHSPVTQGDARVTDEDIEAFAGEAEKLGIRNLARLRQRLETITGPLRDDGYALDLARAILDLASSPVLSADAYVLAAVFNSPHEVQAQFERLSKGWPA